MGARSTDVADVRALQARGAFEAERRLTWIRLFIMASGSALFPFVTDRPGVIAWLGYTMLAAGWLYSLGVLAIEPYKRYPILLSATFTTLTDTLMTLVWVVATGGLSSPWVIALYVVTVTLSFRHGARYTLLGTTLCAVGYVGAGAWLGQLAGHGIDVAVHVFYLFVLSGSGALIAHERQSELASRVRLLDMAQEVAQIGSWEWTIATGNLRWSESLYRIFGLPLDAPASYEAYMGAIAADDRDAVSAAIAKAREDLQPFRFDHRITRPDGSTRWLHCRGRVIVGSDGRAIEMLGSAQDVTERREMQSQLELSSKLASLGTLASGIAHEINNPLAYVSNNLAIVERHLQRDAIDAPSTRELRDAVAAAQHGSRRVRDIVRGLRTFARAEDDARTAVDIAGVADLAVAMVAHELEGRARFVGDYQGCARVDANESRLSQVLVNLLVNAAQAIEPGAVDDNEVRLCVREATDGRVVIEVSDTGSGVSEEHLPHIFDPFFTTKPTGVGNGLGLSICHGIVRDLDGDIEVERREKRGTTFRVFLPASTGKAAPVREPTSSASDQERRRPRLLVIDDEGRYATSLRMLLEPDYDAVVCRGASEALERLRGGERYDVILCDLMMPEMTGMALHDELASTDLGTGRMIFLTGGPTTEAARTFLERPGVRYVVKPAEYPELQAVIEEVIAASRFAAA
jgi:PAS domain S-box-containing protein